MMVCETDSFWIFKSGSTCEQRFLKANTNDKKQITNMLTMTVTMFSQKRGLFFCLDFTKIMHPTRVNI